MASDLVTRLRKANEHAPFFPLFSEAADALEAHEREAERLREALRDYFVRTDRLDECDMVPGGPRYTGWCLACRQEWVGRKERHAPGCLAAPEGAGK